MGAAGAPRRGARRVGGEKARPIDAWNRAAHAGARGVTSASRAGVAPSHSTAVRSRAFAACSNGRATTRRRLGDGSFCGDCPTGMATATGSRPCASTSLTKSSR